MYIYQRLISLEGMGLFKFEESLSKILISSASARFIVENWDNIWCILMHLRKSAMRLQITAFKNCKKWTPVLKIKRIAHSLTEKQSNQDWNASIHLKTNEPPTKVSLIFWFLFMMFCWCFYHQLCVKWVCIGIEIPKICLDVWHWMKGMSNGHPW